MPEFNLFKWPEFVVEAVVKRVITLVVQTQAPGPVGVASITEEIDQLQADVRGGVIQVLKPAVLQVRQVGQVDAPCPWAEWVLY